MYNLMEEGFLIMLQNGSGIIKYILEKVARLLFLLISISIITFFLLSKSPIDPIKALVGTDSTITTEQREEIRRHWDLDKPMGERFEIWVRDAVRGDLGTSMIYRRPVINVIGEKFLSSLGLMLVAWIFSGILGFTLGVISGLHRGKLVDKLIKGYCYTILSTPTFWIGIILISIFSVKLNIFPVALGVPIGVEASEVTFYDLIKHMVLPAATLSIVGIGNICLHTREKVIDILNSEYILFAKARGESRREIIRRHVLRNAILPALTLQFLSFSELFLGTIFAEKVFSYPGLGEATVTSALKGDLPLLMGIVIISVIFVYTGNLIGDIIHKFVDPRIREGNLYEE